MNTLFITTLTHGSHGQSTFHSDYSGGIIHNMLGTAMANHTCSSKHCHVSLTSLLLSSCSVMLSFFRVFLSKDSFLSFHFRSNPWGFLFTGSFRAIDYTTVLLAISLSLSEPKTRTYSHLSSCLTVLWTFPHISLPLQQREGSHVAVVFTHKYTDTYTHRGWCSVQIGKNKHSYKGQILRDRRSVWRMRREEHPREHTHIKILSISSLTHPASFSLSPLSPSFPQMRTHAHTHMQRQTPLSHRSRSRAVKSRRSRVAGVRQESCCRLNKAREGVRSPGENSSCEMPRREPGSNSCGDLKVSFMHRWWSKSRGRWETERGWQKKEMGGF